MVQGCTLWGISRKFGRYALGPCETGRSNHKAPVHEGKARFLEAKTISEHVSPNGSRMLRNGVPEQETGFSVAEELARDVLPVLQLWLWIEQRQGNQRNAVTTNAGGGGHRACWSPNRTG